MLGAVVFAVVAWLAAFWIKKPLALAVAGGMAGCVWTAPHIPAAVGLGSWAHIAQIACLALAGACLVGVYALVRIMRRGRKWEAEIDEFESLETIPADFEGLGRHFYRDDAGPARMPRMLRDGARQALSLASSDVAFAARGIARLRSRWQGRPGRLARAASVGSIDRERGRGIRQSDRRAA